MEMNVFLYCRKRGMFVKFPEAREKGERGRNGQWSGELGRDGVEMLERLKMLE